MKSKYYRRWSWQWPVQIAVNKLLVRDHVTATGWAKGDHWLLWLDIKQELKQNHHNLLWSLSFASFRNISLWDRFSSHKGKMSAQVSWTTFYFISFPEQKEMSLCQRAQGKVLKSPVLRNDRLGLWDVTQQCAVLWLARPGWPATLENKDWDELYLKYPCESKEGWLSKVFKEWEEGGRNGCSWQRTPNIHRKWTFLLHSNS